MAWEETVLSIALKYVPKDHDARSSDPRADHAKSSQPIAEVIQVVLKLVMSL